MVRLNRGGRGRGRPIPRPQGMPRMPMRPMSPMAPFPRPPMMRGSPRGRILRPGPPHPHLGPPPPPLGVPPHPPRLFRPPPPPPPPHHPLHAGRPLSFPPHQRRFPPGLPQPPPLPPPPPFSRPPFRGKVHGGLGPRGGRGSLRGGRGIKRLGTTNGRAKKVQKRKEKTEGDFFCETCDRGFKTQEKLDEHISQHEVCGRDGCTFFGHPKIIMKHIQAQHDSGLYNRIVFTQNPADIAKWIAERKSRFPTKDNVEKKQAQRNEMQQRGERLQTDNKPFRNSWQDRRQAWTRNNNQQSENRKRKNEDSVTGKPKALVLEDPDAKRGNLPRFIGTAAFKTIIETIEVVDSSEETLVISDDEESVDSKTSKPVEKPVVSNILASLAANYGTDVTDDDDDDDDVQIVHTTLATSLNKSAISTVSEVASDHLTNEPASCKQNKEAEEGSDSGPEECSVDREDKSGVPLVNVAKEPKVITSTEKSPTENSTKNQPQNSSFARQYPMRRRRPTLLEKLLQNEIRHERNIILQCVRYVVKNNYLGMGPVH